MFSIIASTFVMLINIVITFTLLKCKVSDPYVV